MFLDSDFDIDLPPTRRGSVVTRPVCSSEWAGFIAFKGDLACRGKEVGGVPRRVSVHWREDVMRLYFAPLIGLVGVCGVPALVAAGIVLVGRIVYVSVRKR